jgi:hypothetical protein
MGTQVASIPMPRLTIAMPTINRAYIPDRVIESALARTHAVNDRLVLCNMNAHAVVDKL